MSARQSSQPSLVFASRTCFRLHLSPQYVPKLIRVIFAGATQQVSQGATIKASQPADSFTQESLRRGLGPRAIILMRSRSR